MLIQGLGEEQHSIAVYMANIPPLTPYQQLTCIHAVEKGEIHAIGQACGNGWRKVFNVYAKLLYALDGKRFGFNRLAESWQQYRDNYLLQAGCDTALLFSKPDLAAAPAKRIHIIMGRTYAKTLPFAAELEWLDDEFAIHPHFNCIVCPYFDYRQLSNIKIIRLTELMLRVRESSTTG